MLLVGHETELRQPESAKVGGSPPSLTARSICRAADLAERDPHGPAVTIRRAVRYRHADRTEEEMRWPFLR